MEVKKLGSLTTKIGSGITPRGGASVYLNRGTYLIRSQNIYNHTFEKEGLVCISEEIAKRMKGVEVKENDVLINITGDSVARTFIVPKEFLPARVNQHVCILRTNSELDPYYLYYFLIDKSTQNHLLSLAASGGTRNALTKRMLEDLEIKYPSYNEQIQIRNYLNAIQNKISLNTKKNEVIEKILQTIFKSWFVDFDFPNEHSLPYRSSGGKLNNTSLGLIPNTWKVGIVSDLGKVICGKTPSTRILENYGIDTPFITIPDMHGRIFVTSTERRLSKIGVDSQKNKTLPPLSICVSCIATPGLVILTSSNAQTNQQINSIVPKAEYSPYYCYFAMKELTQTIRTAGSGGSVFSNLNTSNFSRLPVVLPDERIMTLFNRVVTPLFESIHNNYKESNVLGNIRDHLLPKIISGEITA